MNKCDICGRDLRPGDRILWRVLKNTEEETGFSATHIVCPRLFWNLGVLVGGLVLGLMLPALLYLLLR